MLYQQEYIFSICDVKSDKSQLSSIINIDPLRTVCLYVYIIDTKKTSIFFPRKTRGLFTRYNRCNQNYNAPGESINFHCQYNENLDFIYRKTYYLACTDTLQSLTQSAYIIPVV